LPGQVSLLGPAARNKRLNQNFPRSGRRPCPQRRSPYVTRTIHVLGDARHNATEGRVKFNRV
jgi:hypothetical protein